MVSNSSTKSNQSLTPNTIPTKRVIIIIWQLTKNVGFY